MALVLVIAAMLWAVGHFLKASISARLVMMAILFMAVLAIQVVFPMGHPLREATGGSVGEWLVLGSIGLVVWGYSRGLSRLRTHTNDEHQAHSARDPSSTELDRNARHIVLREIGGPGQKKLKEARVLVVGAGGLGSSALQYLAAAGVGTIGVIDDDVVENSNLQRQVIHTDTRIGMPKVFSAEIAMKAQNPFIVVRPYNRRFTSDIADDLVAEYDLVLDGTDDVETRYLVNDTIVKVGVPLVSAAISQWEGQLGVFDPAKGGPCYRCLFPEPAADGLAPSCAEGGVLGPLPGVVGAMMAAEAVKLLADAGDTLIGRLMIYDALRPDSRVISVKRRTDCQTCGNGG
ncbi:MAG: HesA/MoeB/ThiF family protein [Boseongicola sp.]